MLNIKDFFFAFLIYLSTVAQAPQTILFALIFLIGLYFSFFDIVGKKIKKSDLILLLLIGFTSVIFVIGKLTVKNVNVLFFDPERSHDIFPYTIILWGTIFFSKNLSQKALIYILYFICFEALIAVFEFLIGVQYIIFPGESVLNVETTFGSTDMMYYNRVFGLSANVSALGCKLVAGITIVFFLMNRKAIKTRKALILIGLIFIATILSFQRTAILVVVLFVILYILFNYSKLRIHHKLILIATIATVFVILILNLDSIIFQFTRGRNVDMKDPRTIVFALYINYIQGHLFFGNFAEKIYMSLNFHSYHSHNSFLQTIATIGITGFAIWLLYLKSIIKKQAIIFVFPFFSYSLVQYGIFWGCSLFDVVMYAIIFQIGNEVIVNNHPKDKHEPFDGTINLENK